VMLDPDGVLALLAALCAVAQRDAKRGDPKARAWLAELQACRPRKVRVR
jgi:hypothetical protein